MPRLSVGDLRQLLINTALKLLSIEASDYGCNAGASHRLGELSPQMGRLAPTVKHTGQESGGKLCEILKF